MLKIDECCAFMSLHNVVMCVALSCCLSLCAKRGISDFVEILVFLTLHIVFMCFLAGFLAVCEFVCVLVSQPTLSCVLTCFWSKE